MNQIMTTLQKVSPDQQTNFVRVLFGLSSPTPVLEDTNVPCHEAENLEFVDQSLNDSQKDAIRFALASREVALIHGPPGVCMPPFHMTTTGFLTVHGLLAIHEQSPSAAE